jgi:hypothetical protein
MWNDGRKWLASSQGYFHNCGYALAASIIGTADCWLRKAC